MDHIRKVGRYMEKVVIEYSQCHQEQNTKKKQGCNLKKKKKKIRSRIQNRLILIRSSGTSTKTLKSILWYFWTALLKLHKTTFIFNKPLSELERYKRRTNTWNTF